MAVATDVRLEFAGIVEPILLAISNIDETFELVQGELKGPQTDKDRGSVWVAVVEPNPDIKRLQELEVHLRVFKRQYVSRGADVNPYDPSTLEAIGEAVQTSLNGLRGDQAGFGRWYMVVRQEFDLDLQFVELTIVTSARNPFV